MGIRAHAASALWGERSEFGAHGARRVEQLLGPVAEEPVFEQLQVGWIVPYVRERHLVRAPRSLSLVSVDFLRAGPALRRAQHDHRPLWSERGVRGPCLLLERADLSNGVFERRRHQLMH